MSEPENVKSDPSEVTSDWGSGGMTESIRDLTGKTLGDFQVERLLGRGGMGEVYLARQISLNRPVALKVLRPDLLTQPTYLSRFEAEATAVAKLNHPNIVHIYTLGCIDGIRFIAMEYVQGTNLKDYLQKKGALDLALALSIMKQAGVAIGAAGELGLIHRDIKPENLLLTRKGQVKVADFGLCRDTDAGRVHLTLPGVTMGTPLYMSPEQAQGQALDHRSDLYSLGVTFYHMLGGEPPFRADTALALAMKHVKETPASLLVHRPEIPPDLDRLVLKLIAKAPADRYQSAAEMLRDLSKIRESMQTVSLPVPTIDTVSVATKSLRDETARTDTALANGSRRGEVWRMLGDLRIGKRALAGLIAVFLIGGLAWGWFTRPENLLSEGSKEPEDVPALWMTRAWESIPKQGNAEAQYHFAQVRASREDLEASWLAVPGHFPASKEWARASYIQLARLLIREHDTPRLKILANEIVRWKGAQTHEKELAEIIHAAIKTQEGDLDAVIEDFTKEVSPDFLSDPGLLELSVEVTSEAARVASEPGVSVLALQRLRDIQRKLMSNLFFTDSREQGQGSRGGRVNPS
jgi:hypothetical protein